MPGTIEGVEIASAGMDWPACTGNATVTMDALAAVVASQADPHVQPPRVRLGHFSAVNDGQPQWDPFAALGDAEPAFGHFENLRLANDGATLVADAIDVPDWLVEAAPSAYPNRSPELMRDVETPGGKRYACVCTAVAFLGAALPAMSDLEDLQALIAGGPDAVAARKDQPMPDALSVSSDTIRRRFNLEWAVDDPLGLGTYWWWARDVRVDPDEVIADDDDGGLWSIPFETDGQDDVTFGDPVRVRQDFVPVAAATQRVSGAARTISTFSRPNAAEKTAARPHPEAHASGANPNEGTNMDENVRKALATAHGLDPDEATEEQINEAVLNAANPEQPAPVNEPVETPVEGEPVETTPDPVLVAATRQITALSEEVNSLKADREARAEADDKARRDGIINAAVNGGQFTREQGDKHYRPLLDIDEARTVDLINAIAPSRVTVLQRGDVAATAATASNSDALLAATRERHGLKPRQEA